MTKDNGSTRRKRRKCSMGEQVKRFNVISLDVGSWVFDIECQAHVECSISVLTALLNM